MSRQTAACLLCAATFAGALTACSRGDGAPARDAPPIIETRQANFKAIAGAFKAVRGELEGEAPDFALIAAKAKDINARAQQVPNHFPALTSTEEGYETEALPAIWKTPEEFKAAARTLADESAKLAVLAEGSEKDAVVAQAMMLGKACKDCHDKFRLDDEKK